MTPTNNQPISSPGFVRRIRRSIAAGLVFPETEKESRRWLRNNLVLHFRPATVPESTLEFTLTWGLGGTAAVLVLLLIGTGLLLKFVYQPFPDLAYESILALETRVSFGRFVRNIHHWSANLLVLVVFLHFLRVFFTGAFLPPRRFNWIIGLGLFLGVMAANFTGYLLPWDQLAYWAITICTGVLDYLPGVGPHLQRAVRGGSEIGPDALRIFFALHTAVLPIVLVALMAFHFWRVRKAGGLVVPRSPGQEPDHRPRRVATMPHLILRELVAALVVVASVLLFSVFFDAPLGDRANPGLSPNPTKAPWYFMGFQETLLHFHPWTAVFIIPSLMAGALVSLPYAGFGEAAGGVWFASAKGRRLAAGASAAALIAAPAYIVLDERLLDFAAWLPGVPPVLSGGLLPLAALFALGWVLLAWVRRRFAPDTRETLQTIFVFFTTVWVALTITGIAFRGAGMQLVPPWGR